MNKQEKNIKDVLTFDEIGDIVDVFIDKVYYTDETVALIANKKLIEYAMDKLLNDDCITVKRVDLELDSEDAEYMILVNGDGYMVVQPIEYYDNKYFKAIEYAFVDMDGIICQTTIDNLLERNIPIVLFGDEDGYECECGVCKTKCNEMNIDEDSHGFSISKSDDNGYTSYSFYSSEKIDKNDIEKILKIIGF